MVAILNFEFTTKDIGFVKSHSNICLVEFEFQIKFVVLGRIFFYLFPKRFFIQIHSGVVQSFWMWDQYKMVVHGFNGESKKNHKLFKDYPIIICVQFISF
jgi:hypothetical protein